MVEMRDVLQDNRPLVVGAVGDSSVLGETIGSGQCDLIELRLDVLGTGSEVRSFAERHSAAFPLLLTARHPAEGGHHDLDEKARLEALEVLFDRAAALDLELRTLATGPEIWDEAGSRGVLRIASRHDFDRCPEFEDLQDSVAAMRDAGADVAKLAFRIEQPADLQIIPRLLRECPGRLAVMGMGPLAPVSRLLAAHCGSLLNYGYLGSGSTAPGQWPARLLKEALAHDEADAG